MTSLSHLVRCALLTITGCVALTSFSYGAQPPDVVHSDANLNTAMGTDALLHVTPGNGLGESNTASGFQALNLNTTGSDNTASGVSALLRNETGSRNTAFGVGALEENTGSDNTASGFVALGANTTGNFNTAVGYEALYHNMTGFENTAVGYKALTYTTGQRNVALGQSAGYFVTTGSNNIEIGNFGVAADNAVIRIGTQGVQTATYLAGVSGTHVTGAAVYVTSTGQLGVLASSERYKTAVAPMGSRTEKLRELRPITFRLNSDPRAGMQYGLIAEEVAKVYPELVIRNAAGQAEGVRYEELTPMLLNEVQRQQQELQELKRQVAKLQELNHKRRTVLLIEAPASDALLEVREEGGRGGGGCETQTARCAEESALTKTPPEEDALAPIRLSTANHGH